MVHGITVSMHGVYIAGDSARVWVNISECSAHRRDMNHSERRGEQRFVREPMSSRPVWRSVIGGVGTTMDGYCGPDAEQRFPRAQRGRGADRLANVTLHMTRHVGWTCPRRDGTSHRQPASCQESIRLAGELGR
jgi:hypothetical protein